MWDVGRFYPAAQSSAERRGRAERRVRASEFALRSHDALGRAEGGLERAVGTRSPQQAPSTPPSTVRSETVTWATVVLNDAVMDVVDLVRSHGSIVPSSRLVADGVKRHLIEEAV